MNCRALRLRLAAGGGGVSMNHVTGVELNYLGVLDTEEVTG